MYVPFFASQKCAALLFHNNNLKEILMTLFSCDSFVRKNRFLLRKTYLQLALLACTLPAAWTAQAQTVASPFSEFLAAPGSAGLGFVTRVERSPYVGGGNRKDLLPLYLYEGERFFVHANQLGIKFVPDAEQRVDVFLRRRLEGFPEDGQPAALKGMAVRNTGVDLGATYHYKQPWGTLHASFLHDVSSVSNGNELALEYSYDWRSGRLALRPSLSVSVRDAKLNDYYYGVLAGEAAASRAAYAPGSGTNVALNLYGSYDLSERWRLLGGVSVAALDSRIKDSPIVRKGLQPSFFIGAAYDFGSYKEHLWANEKTPTYVRVLYGKAGADSCHLAEIITFKCADLEQGKPTSIAGIHIGKPFIERLNDWPLDFVGYAGVVHHNDRNLQADGMQVDLFMKAYYYGFPWSAKVKTRLGWGLGVSYANRVPYAEASSQAARNRPTSRLLNYLDPTIDVSLGDLIGSRNLKDTYVGVGVSHRSGIFGSSRLLGDVDGGSNYIYTYLEMKI